ncbi:MAG TPA: 5-oxoprolinase subunit PxpB [Gemmatimonadales bacterium]|nr:5-oxoprolinase subunit PxpB [Gemmatimonadales bacterium]
MTGVRVREAGDSALLVELDAVIDPVINARAIAIAAAIDDERLAGVRDVVPTYRSVALHFDPLVIGVEAVRAAVERALFARPRRAQTRVIEVPVVYGGDAGPDLGEVAGRAGLAPDVVVQLHASETYRVFMLGFLPGFPYLASVDERIAAPRRAVPRLRVPAGSVGIAGRQTGIYPMESPGGWNIIGRTGVRVFDPGRVPPALFQPGDSVRFVPSPTADVALGHAVSASPSAAVNTASRSVTVVRPGLFTTVQDGGRWGHQAHGVPVSGALDNVSHRLANAALGNAPDAATLEVTLSGPEVRFDHDAKVAIAGADLQAAVDGARLPLGAAAECRAGGVLQFGERRFGARAYVAFDGGVDVPPVLGSRATHVRAGLGGYHGRALAAGDRLALGPPGGRQARAVRSPGISIAGGAKLRVLPGPQQDFFHESALDLLEGSRFVVTPNSDRMGYRLSGARLPRIEGMEMISDAAFAGGIQVPASGEPILLMADRQTTGGYPQIAVVVTADLARAGQLAPGDWVEFVRCSRAEAIDALAAQEAMFGASR